MQNNSTAGNNTAMYKAELTIAPTIKNNTRRSIFFEFSIINIFQEGVFSILLDDSDLFWGYSISVDLDRNLTIGNAEMSG